MPINHLDLHHFGANLQALKKMTVQEEKRMLLAQALLDPRQVQLWVYCLSPLVTFGVKDVPARRPPCDKAVEYEPEQLFTALLSRKLTGHEAQAAIYDEYHRLNDVPKQLAFRAILQRRPDCGVSIATINSVIPGTIPEFQAMLAKPWNEAEVKRLIKKNGAMVEPKYDGERRIIINDGPNVRMFSREGREDIHFPAMTDYLRQILSYHPWYGAVVLDAELYPNDNDFARLASVVRAKREWPLEEANLALIIFDIMPLAAWKDQNYDVIQHNRSAMLDTFLSANGTYVRRCETNFVRTFEEADDLYLRYLDAGLEGVIIKDPQSVYAFKRSASWIKRKIEDTVDLTVERLLPGDAGKKFENSLGRLVCMHNGVQIDVSPGRMPHEERQKVWDNQADYVGKTIEVLFQNVTPDGSLRHPRFKRWRNDRE